MDIKQLSELLITLSEIQQRIDFYLEEICARIPEKKADVLYIGGKNGK